MFRTKAVPPGLAPVEVLVAYTTKVAVLRVVAPEALVAIAVDSASAGINSIGKKVNAAIKKERKVALANLTRNHLPFSTLFGYYSNLEAQTD